MNERARFTKRKFRCEYGYIIPKLLFDFEFSNLTNNARTLYAILQGQIKSCIENQQYDINGDVFMLMKREQMQHILGLSDKTITRIINELKNYSLLEEIRPGWTSPNKIYGHIFYEYIINAFSSAVKFFPIIKW